MLHTFISENKLTPPVFSTSASINEGIDKLYYGIKNHINILKDEGLYNKKRLDRQRNRVLGIIKNSLIKDFWSKEKLDLLDAKIKNIKSLKISPYKLAKDMLS